MITSDERTLNSIERLAGLLRMYSFGVRYYAHKLANHEANADAMWISKEIEIQADKLLKLKNYLKKNEKTKTIA